MTIERKLIISILKLTKTGPVSYEVVKKDARIPSDLIKTLLEKLENLGLLYVQNQNINVDNLNRLKLAIHALHLGADLENVGSLLDWKEFEAITAIAFERNGYIAKKNLRFKHGGRRWEIDILVGKEPILVCVDCKHWHHGMYPSATRRIVEEQVQRTRALADSWPRLTGKTGFESWTTAKLLPAVLSLTKPRFKFHNKVPIVPILQIQDFIGQLPGHIDSLKHFRVQANRLI
jgi:Holliday junction resolvase-like predicted endonuclease